MSPGTSVKRTDKIVKDFEERLIPLTGNGEVLSVSSFIGFSSTDSGSSEKGNTAQILVELSSIKEGRKRPVSVVMGEAEKLTRNIPGAENIFFQKGNKRSASG